MDTTTAPTAPALADVITVGDFLSCSWGYDQTNVNFYEVTGVTAKSVKLIPVASASLDDDGGPITHVAPLAGSRRSHDSFLPVDRSTTKKAHVQQSNRRNAETGEVEYYWTVSVRFESFAWASKWDCAPVYETGASWGH